MNLIYCNSNIELTANIVHAKCTKWINLVKKLDITNHWRLHSHCLCNYGNHKNFNITETLKMSLKAKRSFLVLKSLVLSDLKLWHRQIIPSMLITLGSSGSWTRFSFPYKLWTHCWFCGQNQKDKFIAFLNWNVLSELFKCFCHSRLWKLLTARFIYLHRTILKRCEWTVPTAPGVCVCVCVLLDGLNAENTLHCWLYSV